MARASRQVEGHLNPDVAAPCVQAKPRVVIVERQAEVGRIGQGRYDRLGAAELAGTCGMA